MKKAINWIKARLPRFWVGAVSKRYICECGKKQTVQEMKEEIGEGYTQYCCKKCGDVLIDDIKGVVYCNVC